MKSIVSSLVLVAVLASAGVNAAPATGSEKAVTEKTGSVASKPAAVHGAIANSAKDTEPAGQHALSSTPKKQTLSKTSTTTSTAQHGSKKDKKRTRKHRKTQSEETGQKMKTKTKSKLSKSKSKSKDHLPASHNTPSASRTDRETSASLTKPKSDNQPRAVVEAEALYARRIPSRAQQKRIAEKIKKAKAAKKAKQQGDGDQDARDLTSDSLSSRDLEEALEARFVKKLKQKWNESKANRLQKAATKAQGKADAAATKAGINTEQQEARDIIEDEFEARDLADESDVLEARMRRWRKFTKPTSTDESTDKREFDEDVAARGYFDEELEMREFDEAEDLFAREYFDDDELAARDYEDWEVRDVSDEFDLRDLVEIDELD